MRVEGVVSDYAVPGRSGDHAALTTDDLHAYSQQLPGMPLTYDHVHPVHGRAAEHMVVGAVRRAWVSADDCLNAEVEIAGDERGAEVQRAVEQHFLTGFSLGLENVMRLAPDGDKPRHEKRLIELSITPDPEFKNARINNYSYVTASSADDRSPETARRAEELLERLRAAPADAAASSAAAAPASESAPKPTRVLRLVSASGGGRDEKTVSPTVKNGPSGQQAQDASTNSKPAMSMNIDHDPSANSADAQQQQQQHTEDYDARIAELVQAKLAAEASRRQAAASVNREFTQPQEQTQTRSNAGHVPVQVHNHFGGHGQGMRQLQLPADDPRMNASGFTGIGGALQPSAHAFLTPQQREQQQQQQQQQQADAQQRQQMAALADYVLKRVRGERDQEAKAAAQQTAAPIAPEQSKTLEQLRASGTLAEDASSAQKVQADGKSAAEIELERRLAALEEALDDGRRGKRSRTSETGSSDTSAVSAAARDVDSIKQRLAGAPRISKAALEADERAASAQRESTLDQLTRLAEKMGSYDDEDDDDDDDQAADMDEDADFDDKKPSGVRDQLKAAIAKARRKQNTINKLSLDIEKAQARNPESNEAADLQERKRELQRAFDEETRDILERQATAVMDVFNKSGKRAPRSVVRKFAALKNKPRLSINDLNDGQTFVSVSASSANAYSAGLREAQERMRELREKADYALMRRREDETLASVASSAGVTHDPLARAAVSQQASARAAEVARASSRARADQTEAAHQDARLKQALAALGAPPRIDTTDHIFGATDTYGGFFARTHLPAGKKVEEMDEMSLVGLPWKLVDPDAPMTPPPGVTNVFRQGANRGGMRVKTVRDLQARGVDVPSSACNPVLRGLFRTGNTELIESITQTRGDPSSSDRILTANSSDFSQRERRLPKTWDVDPSNNKFRIVPTRQSMSTHY